MEIFNIVWENLDMNDKIARYTPGLHARKF